MSTIAVEDLVYIEKWHNEPSVKTFTNTIGKENKTELTEWFYADYLRSANCVYIIRHEEPVGYLTFCNREIGFVIGEQYRNLGYAKEATKTLCQTAFKCGYRKLIGRTLLKNDAAKHILKSIGFQYEGTQRKEILHFDKYMDLEVYSLFEDEIK